MKLKDKMSSALAVLKAKAGTRIPLAVRFQVTDLCNNRCAYCGIWKTKQRGMSTEQVFSLLREMRDMGTRRISFSGGEPLLREDIGQIIDYTKELGMSPSMNSRGALIEKRIGQLKNLDLIKISIDGPEEVHDRLSGRKGAFAQSLLAVETAQKHGIKVTLATTLTRHNIAHLDFLLDLARRRGTVIAFQPLKRLYRGVKEMGDLYPSKEEFGRAVEGLIRRKREGGDAMRNSLIGLEHIRRWPDYPELECSAGKLFCIVETNGDLYPCDRIKYPEALPNCLELGFREAFAQLPETQCSGCGFCGALELNFLMAFKLGTVGSVWRLVKSK
ncbi:MAG: radical SAM protein [Elusimicrobiota bacterium]